MQKRAKVTLALLVIATGGLIAFAGAAPEAYKTVAEVTGAPDAFEGTPVQVKASVLEGSLRGNETPVRFVLEDGRARLLVEWSDPRPLPDHEAMGTLEGRMVVVTGTLAKGEDGRWSLLATDLQVGCASKYEPAAQGE